MTTALRPSTPLYEPGLLRALRMVERDQVGAYGLTTPLRTRTDEAAPAWLISALFVLRRDDLVCLDPPRGADLWRSATLTALGRDVLAAWTQDRPAPVRPFQAVGSVTAILHYIATEDGRPRTLATEDGPRWIALCRAWTHPARVSHGSGLVRCARCAAHLVPGAP
ncbi:hypothetical protein [Alloactinosynnema sp. L-07]|uniref:hypothetical protein n=1 Tax=Alloactinosynnema sp. L-07 TaxID=1653480 RepID=UPI00065EF384|nr:hypothetical protein [Alloactinosynnema sp. L-07]CRK57665.1 hypothetical protein [Alloactinosynnema sp. L-07]